MNVSGREDVIVTTRLRGQIMLVSAYSGQASHDGVDSIQDTEADKIRSAAQDSEISYFLPLNVHWSEQ